MDKFKYEFVKNELYKRGYKLLSIEHNKDIDNIKIQTKEGYLAYLTCTNLIIDNKSPIIFGFSNPYWEYNVRLFISTMNGNSSIINVKKIVKSKRNRILVHALCECGVEFNWIFCNDLNKTDKFMCQKCKKKITSAKRRLTLGEVKVLFKQYGYNILSTEKNFNKMFDKILVEDECGYKGYMTIRNVERGQHFSIFSNKLNNEFLIYNANMCMKNMGIKTTVESVDNTKYYKGGFNCICECGNKFTSPIYSLIGGSKTKCQKCANSISRYELMVKDFLDKNNIQYIQQYTINQCRDILPLPFDFFVDNKLIEVDGEGHYHPCNFNQISNEDSIKTFNSTKKHDLIKDEYCNKNNIKLLRIPYYDFNKDKYKEKILSFIRE